MKQNQIIISRSRLNAFAILGHGSHLQLRISNHVMCLVPNYCSENKGVHIQMYNLEY